MFRQYIYEKMIISIQRFCISETVTWACVFWKLGLDSDLFVRVDLKKTKKIGMWYKKS